MRAYLVVSPDLDLEVEVNDGLVEDVVGLDQLFKRLLLLTG